jgi:hypothetical protein
MHRAVPLARRGFHSAGRIGLRAGLIERGRDAQRRPCRLVAAPLKEVAGFTEGYRQFWEQSFDRLDDYVQKLQTKGRKHVRKKQQR